MDSLKSLSERYGDFYVPRFAVSLGTRDLIRDLGVGVSQVEANRELGAMGRFSFTVVNSFNVSQRTFESELGEDLLELLSFGAKIKVAFGYGDNARLKTVVDGIVTEISTNFPEDGAPELTVSGYDGLFPLSLGKRSDNHRGKTDSEVVQLFTSRHHLGSDIVKTLRHEQIEQNQESDLDFLKKLAERNHFEFYIDDKRRLRFGPPNDGATDQLILTWGTTLLSFKPEVNLAEQVASVAVYGWDRDKKQPIVGRASAGEESGHDPRRKSGGQQLQDAIGQAPVLEMRQPVFTEAEATTRAKAALNDRAKRYLTADAECIGLPELVPDTNVTFAGLGKLFSKTYYIQQAVHKFDSSGYRTRLKLKETSA